MKNINRIAFFNILSILLLQGISFISSPLFARLLDTGGYGNMNSFTIWAGVTCTVFSLQTNMTIVNARVEYPEGEQLRYQSSVLSLSLMVYVLCAVVIGILIGPISSMLQMEKYMIALLLVQSFGSFCVNFLNSKFTYEFKADKNMWLGVGIAVSTLALSLLLVLNMPMETRYYGRILGNALVYGAAGFAVCVWVLWKGKTFFVPRYWKFCLALSIPIVFQNLSYQLLGNSDMLMLKQMTGASDAGIYGLAFTLSGVMFTIFTALNSSWLPFFFEDMKEGRTENAVRQAENFLELFTVLSVGFVLLVREVYHIYAPEDYWTGTDLIPIFVASYYVNFLCTFPVTYQYFHKKTLTVAIATIAVSLLNLGLNYFFIRSFGMFGAAAATLLSHGIQFTIHEVFVRFVFREHAYPFALSMWLKYALAFTGAMVLFYAFPQSWLLRWGIGAVIGLWELYRMWKRKGLL